MIDIQFAENDTFYTSRVIGLLLDACYLSQQEWSIHWRQRRQVDTSPGIPGA